MARKIFGYMCGIGFGVFLFGAAGFDSNCVTPLAFMGLGVLMMLPFTIWEKLWEDNHEV